MNRFRLLLLLALALAAAVPLGVTGYAILGNPAEIRMVSGTEYISGETGQVITRLSDRFGNPITGATCVATIIYPDKTYFLIDHGRAVCKAQNPDCAYCFLNKLCPASRA